MDFSFSEEKEMLRKTVQRFVKKECTREYARELDEKEEFPFDIYEKMADMGWLGLPFPEKYGGSDGDAIDLIIMLEELSKGMLIAGNIYMRTVMTSGLTIYHYGTEEQKDFYLPALIRGDIKFALALTEPNAGSDAASLTTSAIEKDDCYVLNGSKIFCSGAHIADFIQVIARTDKNAPKTKGITVFLVAPKTPGITIRPLKKMGHKSNVTNEVFLDNVEVPKKNILGGLNEGWENLLHSLDSERVGAAAMCVGSAQSAFNDALAYAKEREQFGRPIGKFQAIQHKLANMLMDIEAARLFTYKAAWMVKEGLSCRKEATMAKLFASEAYTRIALDGMQIMGGYGYMMESDMQRHFRDAKLFEIGGGTSEILRTMLAREMGL